MKNFILILSLLSLVGSQLFATHTKGGSIEYSHLNGNTYEITVKIYSDPNTVAYQRQTIQIDYGDNTAKDSISRSKVRQINQDLVIAEYTTTHSYPGGGNYTISVEDNNRSSGIDNINGSINTPLYLESLLRISPAGNIYNHSVQTILCPNSSVVIGDTLNLNMTAYDLDGDSLNYKLAQVKGSGGLTAPGYYLPSGVTIDEKNGTFSWDTKNASQGRYAFLVEIEEYRYGIKIGTINVDFLINVLPTDANFSFNKLTTIEANLQVDSCGNSAIKAENGDTVSIQVQANSNASSSSNNNLTLASYLDSALTYSTVSSSIVSSSQNETTVQLKIIVDDRDSRCAPYSIFFRGQNFVEFYQDKHFFLFVRDSITRKCDTSCSWVGIAEKKLNAKVKVKLAPNPAKQYFEVEVSSESPLAEMTLRLYSLEGKLVDEYRFNSSERLRIDRKELKSGIYFYSIASDNQFLKSGKVIFQ